MSVSLPAFSPTFPASEGQFVQRTSVADLLLRAAHQHPRSGVHLVSGDRDDEGVFIAYPALLDEARRILGGLRAFERRLDARVVLLLERPGDFIPAFWACVLGGFVPCPLAPIRNDAERWAKHLAHVDDLLDGPFFITAGSLKNELPEVVAAADLDDLRAGPSHGQVYQRDLTDAAVLVLTSGSTGNSKAVVLTHGNLLASMAGKTERQRMAASDVTLNWISFDHVAALLEAHFLPLYVGAMQIHAEAATILANPLVFLQLIDRYRVSMTFAPNFLFGQINAALLSAQADLAKPQQPALDLSCLRHIISGGEANVVDTGRRFLDLLAPFGLSRNALWPAFGMTETCAGSIYSREFPEIDTHREFASLGMPIDGLQMRVATDHGEPQPAGEPGELQLHGPMIFNHYYNNEVATRAAFTADGWFRTGDLGRIEEGRLSLVGRSKDSIIVSGVNYFSHELETTLEPLAGIERSFVAAFPTRPKGADTEQLVVTFATSFPLDDEARLHQLIIAVRNTTILLWGFRPALVLPLPKDLFPKTSLGKIQRAVLRKRLEAGELAVHEAYIADVTNRQLGGYTAPEGPAEAAIAGIYAELFGLDAATVSATASFFDLGGTSLDIVRLKRALEDRFALPDLPVVTILQNSNVRSLAARIAQRKRRRNWEYDPIVPLQVTGSKTPLFCVHPGVGEVLIFVNLAKYFVNDRPFFALRARGFNEGEKYFATFDELVCTYTAAIRKRQPHGPYAIAGYSYGGPVAFEIARMLESQGERVAFVGSIDMAPHLMHRMGEVDAAETAVTLAFFLSMIDKKQKKELPGQLRAGLPEQDPCAYLVQNAASERLAELDIDLAKFKAWAKLTQSLLSVGRSYVPSGDVESVTVFHADPPSGTKHDWLNDLKRWDDFSRTPCRYVEVPGEHYEIMGPKHVPGFQAVLRSELDRAFGLT
jgi:acyl-CoA synthetase (AMP-forming)/AMP-acid ligase II/thioesterase domain-containing protein/acyl carrier protein